MLMKNGAVQFINQEIVTIKPILIPHNLVGKSSAI